MIQIENVSPLSKGSCNWQESLCKKYRSPMQSFNEIPEDDARAKIGPRLFVMTLIFSLSIKDRGQRTLAALRRSVISFTGEQISRGTFWERLATNRLLDFLLLLVAESMRQVGAVAMGPKEITSLLENLKVKGILVFGFHFYNITQKCWGGFSWS